MVFTGAKSTKKIACTSRAEYGKENSAVNLPRSNLPRNQQPNLQSRVPVPSKLSRRLLLSQSRQAKLKPMSSDNEWETFTESGESVYFDAEEYISK